MVHMCFAVQAIACERRGKKDKKISDLRDAHGAVIPGLRLARRLLKIQTAGVVAKKWVSLF